MLRFKLFASLIAAVFATTLASETSASTVNCGGFQSTTFEGGSVFAPTTSVGSFDCGFIIIGSDDGNFSEVTFQTIDPVTTQTRVDYSWIYYNTNADGPSATPFGHATYSPTIDTFFDQTNDNGPNFQSGSASFSVAAGDGFGWFINTMSGNSPAGALVLANLSTVDIAPVPIPAGLPLLLTGLLGLFIVRRRRSV
ncbi:MAG: VPLPA-CTERM sorting domain-containing protein [Pseudomonadota bacterium]